MSKQQVVKELRVDTTTDDEFVLADMVEHVAVRLDFLGIGLFDEGEDAEPSTRDKTLRVRVTFEYVDTTSAHEHLKGE